MTTWKQAQDELLRHVRSPDWTMLDRKTLTAQFVVGEWTLDFAAHPVGAPDANEYAWHVTASAGEVERHEDGYRAIGEVLAKYQFEPVPSEEE